MREIDSVNHVLLNEMGFSVFINLAVIDSVMAISVFV